MSTKLSTWATLGAITTIASPVAFMISCGTENTKLTDYNFVVTHLLGDNGPIIREASFGIKGQPGSDEYLLGQVGIEKLKVKIENELSFGPEIFSLKSITIGDTNKISKDNNGEYSPVSNEISLGRSFVTSAFSYDKLDPTENLDLKVQMIFDVLFHEYYHHVANSYLNNIPSGHAFADETIFLEDAYGTRVENVWDKDFLESFKSNLHYDETYIDPLVVDDSIIAASGGKMFKSIGNVYKAQDMFRIANGKDTPSWGAVEKHVGFDGYSQAYKNSNLILTKPVDTSSLGYYYSLSELFARKYQQLNHLAVDPTGDTAMQNGIGYSHSGWIGNESKQAFASQFSVDRFAYESVYEASSHKIRSYRYMSDAPFDINGLGTTESKNLYDLLDRHFGHEAGSDLSYIWGENNSKMVSVGKAELDYSNMDTNIKFGGYVKDDSQKFVGFWNDTKTKFTSYEISTFDYSMRAKQNILDWNYLDLDKTLENKFYTTNDWVDTSVIQDKELYFSTSSSGFEADMSTDATTAFASVRSSKETGIASTYVNEIENYEKYDSFKGVAVNGKISIGAFN